MSLKLLSCATHIDVKNPMTMAIVLERKLLKITEIKKFFIKFIPKDDISSIVTTLNCLMEIKLITFVRIALVWFWSFADLLTEKVAQFSVLLESSGDSHTRACSGVWLDKPNIFTARAGCQ